MEAGYRLKAVIFDIVAECRELKKALSDAGILVIVPFFGVHVEAALKKMLSETELSLEDCLMITNNEQHSKIAALGVVVAGCMEGNFEVPKGVTLLESPEEVSVPYLNQEFCHYRGFPAIVAETERCILREMTVEDTDALYGILSEEAVAAWLSPMSGSREEELDKMKAYVTQVYSFFGYGYWGIFSKKSGELIGRAGFKEGSFPLEAGYVIRHSDWGKGLASEVLATLIEYAAEELACNSVIVKIHEENKASLRVAEKCGFRAAGAEESLLETDGKCSETSGSCGVKVLKLSYAM